MNDFAVRLKQIPWASLEHAYGTAEDVPDLILALRSPHSQERKSAGSHLYGTIFHQGSRYTATIPAITFLCELVSDDTVEDRSEIIELLVHIAIGYADVYLPEGFDIASWHDEAVRFFGIGPYLDWVRESYEAVRQGLPKIMELVGSHDIKMRIRAVYSAAWFKEAAHWTAPIIRAQLYKSINESEIANHLLSLGLLDGYSGSMVDIPLFANHLETGVTPAIKTCAAIALTNVRKGHVDRQVLGVLLSALDGVQEPDIFLWSNGYLDNYAVLALGQAITNVDDEVLNALCRAIATSQAGHVRTIAWVVVKKLFPMGCLKVSCSLS